MSRKIEMKRALDARIAARAFDGRTVFLFGHCNATEEMADYLLSRDVAPAAILDNNPSKQGLVCRGLPIKAPETIKGYNAEACVVLIATRFFAEMSAQLRRLGYGGEIVQVVEYNSFAEYSLSRETLARKKARMLRGAKTLEEIRALYPSQHLVVCPNDALGDAYWAMAFLPAYREKHGIADAAVVAVGDACRQVAEMFGAEEVVTLDETRMDELVQALIFTRENNAIIAHHDRPYTDKIIKWLDRRFLSFIDYYRYAVYGLDKDAPPAPPTKLSPFENRESVPQGRSVILSPYAKSVVELPSDFWERIADDCLRRGYAVYTNGIGEEQAVRGSLPLSAPISQMLAAAEHAGTFIGIRSGLCDVLFAANCRRIVVFPDCCYSTTPHKVEDFFALPGWGKIVGGIDESEFKRYDCGKAKDFGARIPERR
ncbi:MAG: hypothetical protein LBP30_02680 [Clostridiales Family XIII bacterium]|jgi:hypothetical protein|nr:hypothetical protein [Clostridiales Family XIII bacterium]